MHAVFSLVLILLSGNALAQTIDDESAGDIDAAALATIVELAIRDAAEPSTAHIRKLHKSLARNGKGYCGEVALVEGGAFTAFHVILEGGTGPSILSLTDAPETDDSLSAVTVRRLMKNFGCIE